MKKNLAKVLASASFVVALILIVILIVTSFGGIKQEDFDNGLVRGLLIAISVLYIVIAGVTIALLFIQGEALHEIVIKNAKGESVRVSVGVVKREIKKACHMVDGVKFKKIALIGDGFGVTLKLNIKVTDKDLDEVEIATRCYIENCMAKTFGYNFNAIDINIMQLVPKYKADAEEINKEIERQLAAKREEERKELEAKLAEEEKKDAFKADLNEGSALDQEAQPIEEAEFGDETEAPAELTSEEAPAQVAEYVESEEELSEEECAEEAPAEEQLEKPASDDKATPAEA